MLSVRTVHSGGARFAVPEDSIIAVLKLSDDDDATPEDREVLVDLVDDMLLPLLSLGQHLRLERAAVENQVVVLCQRDEVFGLLVERTDAPAPATIQAAAETPAPALAVFRDVARLADGTAIPLLNPDCLALCTLMPVSVAVH
jgi:chemotaxis protein histidine kinase CheA